MGRLRGESNNTHFAWILSTFHVETVCCVLCVYVCMCMFMQISQVTLQCGREKVSMSDGKLFFFFAVVVVALVYLFSFSLLLLPLPVSKCCSVQQRRRRREKKQFVNKNISNISHAVKEWPSFRQITT